MSKESEFLARLRETFKAEAEEHRSSMLTGLMELEKGESGEARERAIIERIFRDAHSLKGAARAVDIRGIERLCKSMEVIFSALKEGHRRPVKKMSNVLYRALDLIAAMTDGSVPPSEAGLEDVLNALASVAAAPELPVESATQPGVEESPKAGPFRQTPVTMSETVRISARRLGSIFLLAEELLSVKQAAAGHAAELRELQMLQQSWRKEWAKAGPAVKKLREQSPGNPSMEKLLGFLDWHVDNSGSVKQKLDTLCAGAAVDSIRAGERVDSLLSEIKTALMLPFSTLLELFPRMVRDLAAEEGKEVTWEVRGEDTRIDRRVLEEIKDPLIHIVRNSISHGIEAPLDRQKSGKPRAAIVSLRVERLDNDKVALSLSDDGAGVDLARVKDAAIARGFRTAVEAAGLDERDALELIFLSGLSTSQMITDISGRGLGLVIARERIEAVGGVISVETTRGKGTTFRVELPLSLATFRGVLVRSRGQTFVVPTVNVEQVLRVDGGTVVSIGMRQSIPIDGQAVSLVNLGDVLGLKALSEEQGSSESSPAILVSVSGTRIAFQIDEVVGEQEVLVKSLGRQLARVRNVSGATVLVTGEVVPILNPSDLVKSVSLAPRASPGDAQEARKATAGTILVVEDSVTSRMLLKGILESAGFQVKTAVDGVEAFATLRVEEFDLLVSDIDMPRMNGFALCEKVRGFAKTADLPIVLVTSLGSREDRERGIDAGANAYIAKADFDQSNLLEVVKRLL
jgi:two-component system, chemotaxis family, sensor kinase CheA